MHQSAQTDTNSFENCSDRLSGELILGSRGSAGIRIWLQLTVTPPIQNDTMKTLQSNNDHCSYWYVNIISLCASNKNVTFSAQTQRLHCALFCDHCVNAILSERFCLCASLSTELEVAASRRPASAQTSCQLWGLAPAAVSRSGPELQGFFCR